MDIAATIKGLKRLCAHEHPEDIVWIDENPWVVDALRGSLHEMAWRGTLTEYFYKNPLHVNHLSKRAITRLEHLEGRLTETDSDDSILCDCEIGLGTYGWKYDPAVIHRAMNSGIRLIDTAETYGYGRVEEALGKALRNNPRTIGDDYPILATKVARTHLSHNSIIKAADRSIGRLEHKIDLYQVHRPNPKYPLHGIVEALRLLHSRGSIGAIGVCNFSVDQLMDIQYEMYPARLSSVQVRYSLVDRGMERALLHYCQSIGLSVIAYSPLGQKFPKAMSIGMPALTVVAKNYGATEAQIALAWLMSWERVIPIPRTNNVDHVNEITESVQLDLSDDDICFLDDAFPITE